jgi:hypothetical protein
VPPPGDGRNNARAESVFAAPEQGLDPGRTVASLQAARGIGNIKPTRV